MCDTGIIQSTIGEQNEHRPLTSASKWQLSVSQSISIIISACKH